MGLFFPSPFTFFKGTCTRGKKQRAQGLRVCAQSLREVEPDALGASFAFGLVFSCWESWAHTGAVGWPHSCAAATKISPTKLEKVPGPLLGQKELGLCASPPWHLEPLDWDPSPAVNSSSGAPQLSCQAVL